MVTDRIGELSARARNFTISQSGDHLLAVTGTDLIVFDFNEKRIIRNYVTSDRIIASAFISNDDAAIVALADGSILRWQFYPEFDDLLNWIKRNRYYEPPSCFRLMRNCNRVPDVLRPNMPPTLEPIVTSTFTPSEDYPIPTATLVIGTPPPR